ncbi:MAG: hypothetical protein AB8G17_11780 [Gammaproteobacteria bacterium]
MSKTARMLSKSFIALPASLWICASAAALPGDVNDDLIVDLQDARQLRAGLGTCSGQAPHQPHLDIDADGCIGLADIRELIAHYGQGHISADVVQLGKDRYAVDGADYVELTFAVAPASLSLDDLQLTVRGDHFGAANKTQAADVVRLDWPYGGNTHVARIYLGADPHLRVGGYAVQDDDTPGRPSGLRIGATGFADLADRRVRNLSLAHDRYLNSYFPRVLERANRADACEDNYPLSLDLEGLLSMFEATRANRYLIKSMDIADAMLAQAADYDDDGYLDFKTTRNPQKPEETRFNVALCDWTAGRAIARLSRVLRTDTQLAGRYRQRAARYQRYVEHDLLEKWSSKLGPANAAMHLPTGVYPVEQDTLIHRVAHFGEIAIDASMGRGGADVHQIIGEQLQRVCNDLEDSKRHAGAVEWDIFMRSRKAGVAIERKYGRPYDQLSDTSHANGTVAFVLAAHLHANQRCAGRPAIDQLITTFLKVIVRKSSTDPATYQFSDFVDGGLLTDGDPPFSLGKYIEDGWIKLGEVDAEVQRVVQSFFKTDKPVHRLQYQGNLARNYALARWQ